MPNEAKQKVYIFTKADNISVTSQNALLKILEEPWEQTVFILVSERPDLLLKTILSRTQEVGVPRLAASDLEPIVRRSGETDEAKIRNTARLAGGDLLELRRLLGGSNDDVRHENLEAFCSIMRLSYNDRHLELMNWAEDVAQL